MKVIKREGHMVEWCPEKVELAIEKANTEVEEEEQEIGAYQEPNAIGIPDSTFIRRKYSCTNSS